MGLFIDDSKNLVYPVEKSKRQCTPPVRKPGKSIAFKRSTRSFLWFIAKYTSTVVALWYLLFHWYQFCSYLCQFPWLKCLFWSWLKCLY